MPDKSALYATFWTSTPTFLQTASCNNRSTRGVAVLQATILATSSGSFEHVTMPENRPCGVRTWRYQRAQVYGYMPCKVSRGDPWKWRRLNSGVRNWWRAKPCHMPLCLVEWPRTWMVWETEQSLPSYVPVRWTFFYVSSFFAIAVYDCMSSA